MRPTRGWDSSRPRSRSTSRHPRSPGTDFFHHRHFIDFAERYRRRLVNRMNEDLIPHPAAGGKLHTNDIGLWSQVPAFQYEPLSASRAWRSAAAALLALACWLAGGAALVAATARYVRP